LSISKIKTCVFIPCLPIVFNRNFVFKNAPFAIFPPHTSYENVVVLLLYVLSTRSISITSQKVNFPSLPLFVEWISKGVLIQEYTFGAGAARALFGDFAHVPSATRSVAVAMLVCVLTTHSACHFIKLISLLPLLIDFLRTVLMLGIANFGSPGSSGPLISCTFLILCTCVSYIEVVLHEGVVHFCSCEMEMFDQVVYSSSSLK